MKKIVIFGAASAIAAAAARCMAEQAAELFLIGRSEEKLLAVRNDLKVRGAQRVEYAVCDLANTAGHAALIEKIAAVMPDFDTVLIAYGVLADQKLCEQSFEETEKQLRINFISAVSLITIVANRFEALRKGTIAVITSVAGDRGRKSNYIYGTAKGALGIFLQGLRNRLCPAGVRVLTLKPGFVDTPMTASFKKGLLFVKPEVVGRGICRALEKGGDVVYLPWFWRFIMLIIRNIPEALYKRMSI